jgi:hypothetical protein
MNGSSTLRALAVSILVAAVCVIRAAGGPGSAEEQDQKLVKAIKAAVKQEVEPGKVEASVGAKATLNTIRKGDVDTLAGTDIAADRDSRPALGERDAINHVAYWVRPVESRNPRLVGIVWPKKGKPRIFYGELLPPG